MPLTIISRGIWTGRPPRKPEQMYKIFYPVSMVFFSFTLRKGCKKLTRWYQPKDNTTEECVAAMQKLQFHDARRNADIRFNFVIAPDGLVYEGRGWKISPTFPHQYRRFHLKALYIGYLGSYTEKFPPPKEYYKTKDELISEGVEKGFITRKFVEVHLRHELIWHYLKNQSQ